MGDRRFAWFSVGFVVAVLLAAATTEARAQIQLRSTIGAQPGLPTNPSLTRPDPQQLDDNDAAPGIAPPIVVEDIDNPAGDQPENLDGLTPVPRLGQRPAIVDGDLTVEREPLSPQDGVIDVAEPLPPEDGGDPTIDTRPPEEASLFENPPADPDPLLFQIEDIDPVRDNRAVARLARLEPYDPIGVRIGSFVLFPELEVGGLATTNVLRSPDARNDVATALRPTARLVSDWSRHALEFRGTGDYSFFSDFDSENDETYGFEARGRIDVTRRTNVQAILNHDRTLESRTAINAQAAGSRTPIETNRAEVALNHRFNRLSLQFRGAISDFAYGDTEDGGVTLDNSDRDYTETREIARATWEFKPTLSTFAEAEINQRDYDRAAAGDGINRTSDGQRYRVGVSFGNTGQILRGEIGIGYGVQSPDAPALRDIDGLILDANATWRVSELTSVLFTARSDVVEANTANVAGALSQSVGVELRHAFRRHLIGSAGLTRTTQDSGDGLIDDRELRATLGVEYFISPEIVAFGNYAHIDFDGVGVDSDYAADEVRLGVRLRR